MYRIYIKANDAPTDRKHLVVKDYHYQYSANTVKYAWHLADILVDNFNVRSIKSGSADRASLMPRARRDVALSKLVPASPHLIGHAGDRTIVVERI